jgi:protein-disulfide isomerase
VPSADASGVAGTPSFFINAEPIYISPAPRARELAEKMAAHFQLEPEIDALPEVDR